MLKKQFRKTSPAAVILMAVMALFVIPSPPLRADSFEASDFILAAECGRCHQETYNSWSSTFHAMAVTDPVFLEALARAVRQSGADVKKICIRCHSPIAGLIDDLDLEEPISREGITCSFCHSISAIYGNADENPFTLQPLRLRMKDGSDSDRHHFENHSVMLSARFCAGCHEWTNPEGLKVFSTYSEWEESFYGSENVPCQQCHMPESTLGSPSMAREEKDPRPSHLHFQMGGHSQDQLVSAIKMEIAADLLPGEIVVSVDLANFKAGHKIPTGLPTRKMHLRADLFDGRGLLLESGTKTFGRVIADRDGNILEDVTDQFLRGAMELSDNRLKPKEKRNETFSFPLPDGFEFALVEVSLEYEIKTPYLDPPFLNFNIDRKRIPISMPSEKQAPDGGGLPTWTIVNLALLAAAILLFFLRRPR